MRVGEEALEGAAENVPLLGVGGALMSGEAALDASWALGLQISSDGGEPTCAEDITGISIHTQLHVGKAATHSSAASPLRSNSPVASRRASQFQKAKQE